MYDLKKNMNSAEMNFPEVMQDMNPKDTPPFLDNGGHYVERIARAFKFFKQCALIGPSGTGKTHIVFLLQNLQDYQCGKSTVV